MADQAKRTVAETPEPWEAGYFNKGHWNWTSVARDNILSLSFPYSAKWRQTRAEKLKSQSKTRRGIRWGFALLIPTYCSCGTSAFYTALITLTPTYQSNTLNVKHPKLAAGKAPATPPASPTARPACRPGPRQRRGPTSRSGRSLQAPSQAWRAGAVRKRRVAPPAARDPPPLRGSQPARPHRPPRHRCAPAHREEPGGRSRAAWGDGKSPAAPCGLAGASEGNGGCAVRRAHQQPKAGLSAGRERPKGARIRAGRARCGPAPHESGRTAAAPPPCAPRPPGSGTRAEAVLSLRPWRPLLRGRWAPERHMKRYAEKGGWGGTGRGCYWCVVKSRGKAGAYTVRHRNTAEHFNKVAAFPVLVDFCQSLNYDCPDNSYSSTSLDKKPHTKVTSWKT